jgi:hypothetical protein
MPTLFYAVVMTALFLTLWISFQNIIYPVLVADMFLILFYGKIPTFMQTMLLLVNAIVWGQLLYNMFAPKKAQ